MPSRIGILAADKRPLARTCGFRQELVRLEDGDRDAMTVPSPTPEPLPPWRGQDEMEF